jgi:alkylation response protein AidB-like acyl-CoA dehydrogenase
MDQDMQARVGNMQTRIEAIRLIADEYTDEQIEAVASELHGAMGPTVTGSTSC